MWKASRVEYLMQKRADTKAKGNRVRGTMMSIDRGERIGLLPFHRKPMDTHTHTQAGTESSTEQKRLKKAEKHAYTHINMHGNVFQPTPSENQTHNNSYVLSGVKPQKQLRSLQTKTTHRHVSVCFIAPR